VNPARFGSAWTAGEQPTLAVALRARTPGQCRVAWEARDVDGRTVDSGDARAQFSTPGDETPVTIAPRLPGVGHYRVAVRLLDAADKLLVTHTATIAVVAPDTREAGYESPYFSWWFAGAHLTEGDIEKVGPLLKLAGIRRSHPKSEALGRPWGLTTGQLGSFAQRVAPADLDARRADYARRIDAAVAAFPHADAANIFHESLNGGGQFPLELYGIPVPLPDDPQRLEAQRQQVAAAVLTARLYREKHPHVRPTLVNTGDSLAGAGMLMRHKVPADVLTALGEESLGQTIPPEMSTAYNFFMLRELARRMGYGEVPVDACYEWKGRNYRDLGERRAAAWRQRDALIAHAWGCRMIPLSGLIQPGNSYHNTVWGDDWMFSRSPQNYPYPSFVTTAHLTRILDRAAFARALPTGSLTVYALEFKRGGGDDRVYALWAARGTAQVAVEFPRDLSAQQSDMFGRTRDLATAGNRLTLTASGEPTYLVAPAAATAVTVGARSYPDDQPPAGAALRVADAMDAPGRWTIAPKPDPRIDNPPTLTSRNDTAFRRLGKYQLRSAADAEKGACLELELAPDADAVPFLPEYAVLKLNTPAPIDGAPATVGVWVKGNSGWGQLMWEFEDADGERWLSCGTGGYGCDIYDWPKQASINFDGWNFVQFPITHASPVRLPNPGEIAHQWQAAGAGNRRIDYPIKLTALAVSMTRHALDLTTMRPVKPVLRLKDLSTY